jgi:hypothetical protein
MRVSSLFVVATFAVSGCSASAQPSTVTAPVQATAPILIGIHAFGSQADLNRLEAFATKSGFPNKQMDAPEGHELVIAFPPGTSAPAVATFIERLRGPEFSSLTFKSAYAPGLQ